jgi:hypothetical protein
MVRLAPYQRDALRLIIRGFIRPGDILKEIWYRLQLRVAEEVSSAHLDAIAMRAPDLYMVLNHWRVKRDSS